MSGQPSHPMTGPTRVCCYVCATPARRLDTFIVCPICGNKRCPKATDHRLDCTNSNEIGQVGSRYNVNWVEPVFVAVQTETTPDDLSMDAGLWWVEEQRKIDREYATLKSWVAECGRPDVLAALRARLYEMGVRLA